VQLADANVAVNVAEQKACQMKWLAVAAMSVALFGCRADQEQQAAKCELEARKDLPACAKSLQLRAS
jgi:hypothetical protein